MLWGSVCPAGSVVPIHVECLSGVMHACVGLYIPFWSSVFLFGALCANLGLCVHIHTGFVCAYMELCISVWGCAHMYGALPVWGCACPTGIYMCLSRIVHTCLELCVLFWSCTCPSRVVSTCPELCMYLWGCECLSGAVCSSLGLWVHIQTAMYMFRLGLGMRIWSACP